MHSERRTQASKLLSAVAKKLQNPRLATLAVRVRLDVFSLVALDLSDRTVPACDQRSLLLAIGNGDRP
jgi:hypothetical protein